MTIQPEAILENNLIKQLVGLGYASVKIHDGDNHTSPFQKCSEYQIIIPYHARGVQDIEYDLLESYI